MVKARSKRSQKLKIAKTMPPGYHKLPGEEYEVGKSELVAWLIEQPEILEFIWDQIKQSGDVVYNPSTGKWQGIDYRDLCPHGDCWDDCPDCRH